MTERARLHRRIATLCAVACTHVLLAFVFLRTSAVWFPRMLETAVLWPALCVAWAVLQLALATALIATQRAALRARAGTPGRARALTLVYGATLQLFASTVTLAIILYAARSSVGHVLGGTIRSLLFGASHLSDLPFDTEWITPTFNIAAGFHTLGSLWVLAASTACWFLIEPKSRERFWVAFDAFLFVALIWVTFRFPLSPSGTDDVELLQAVVRLSVTSLAIVRLSLRLLAPVLGAVERIGFRSLVAARHLRAHKTRFLAASGTLSILAVAVSSCMLVTVLSVMGGFRDDLKRKILGNHAHVVVDSRQAHFKPWQDELQAAQGSGSVLAAAPFIQGEVMLSSVANQAGVILRGVDPDEIGEVTDLKRNLTHGKLDYLTHPEQLLDPPLPGAKKRKSPLDPDFEPAEPERDAPSSKPATKADIDDDVLPTILVGQELARALRLVVGDKVTVVSPRGQLGPTGPVPKSRPFRVAGIFYSGMYEYDMKYAYTSLDVGQRFLNAPGAISGIEIKVDRLERAPEVAATIASAIDRPDLRVRDWQTLNQHLFGALALEKLAMFVTLGIAILIAGFSVFGTLTLLVQEKRKEVGILKAMGTSARAVIRIFMLEGLLIGVAGAALGLGLGFVAIFAAEHFGIRMNPEVYYIDKLPVHLDLTEFTAVGAAAVLVCLAATVFPAYQASRVRPVDALRYD